MQQRRKRGYSTAARSAEIWDRWQKGEGLKSIGRRAHPKQTPYLVDPVVLPRDPTHIQCTRHAYPYPTQARYKERGDPSNTTNIVPGNPRS